jgi:hypothetical protein
MMVRESDRDRGLIHRSGEGSSMLEPRPPLKSRFRGCLVGCAVGDAVGAPSLDPSDQD